LDGIRGRDISVDFAPLHIARAVNREGVHRPVRPELRRPETQKAPGATTQKPFVASIPGAALGHGVAAALLIRQLLPFYFPGLKQPAQGVIRLATTSHGLPCSIDLGSNRAFSLHELQNELFSGLGELLALATTASLLRLPWASLGFSRQRLTSHFPKIGD